MKCEQWMPFTRDGEELELNVEYDATPIISATYWQPAEGGEIEITAVFLDGKAIDPPLSNVEEEIVEAWVISHHDDSQFDDPGDY
jgi:hypothetical protein